jgi:DNA-binding response OmpR family regulator
LVEPYNALGIALSSALRKFAPHHAIRVTQTLVEAEAASKLIKPELLVLDLDPAPGDELAFLDRLRERYPETRVLVIAASPARELRTVRGIAGALQFIGKPFDLADFGATVQALLGPWAAPPTGDVRGTLRDLQILDIVQLKCLALSNSVLRAETPTKKVGKIHFRHGEICHAATDGLGGVPALQQMAQWPEAKFSESELPAEAPKTIDQPWAILLLEVMQRAERGHAKSLGEEPVAASPPAEPPSPPSKTILVVDDTEMLLVFVADVLATADRTFRVLTAATGEAGLKLAATERPDLILLDYSLTDMNGDDVCRALLEGEATARIPVLMMSGHLPELAKTASSYDNVVETLPKPFLSGALINTVEKILAAGPLPEPAPPLSASQSESPPPGPAISAPPHASSSNGHGAVPNETLPTEPSPPDSPSTPTASLVLAPPREAAASTPRWSDPPPPAAIVAELREATITLSLDVVSAELTADFRTGALQLKLAGLMVAVTMDSTGKSPEIDFELGALTLRSDGRINTVRITPTSQSPQSADSQTELANCHAPDEWKEAGGRGDLPPEQRHRGQMRVQMSAYFNVLRVELSPTFQLEGIILQSRSDNVHVQVSDNRAPVMQFALRQVQLDQAHRLTGVSVAAKR